MTRLGEIASINPTLGKRLDTNTQIAFLGMADVSESGSTTGGTLRPFSEVAKGYTPFLNDDLLVAKITPCFENGKIAQASLLAGVGFGSTEFHIVRPHPTKLDARYALHFLRSPQVRKAGQLRMTGSGGQRRVPRVFIEDLDVPLPPLPEQRRIASILDRAESLSAGRQRSAGLLSEFLSARYSDLSESAGASEQALSRAPLKDLGRVVTGQTPPGGLTTTNPADVPFVTPGDLGHGGSVFSRFVDPVDAGTVRTVREGSLLVCCIGSVGKLDTVQKVVAFNQQINAVEWGPQILPNFGHFAVAAIAGKLRARATSTTVPILKKSLFETFEIWVPEIEVQREFSDLVDRVRSLTDRANVAVATSDRLIESIRERAFGRSL
jgi:type I restriction enzyme S subunit